MAKQRAFEERNDVNRKAKITFAKTKSGAQKGEWRYYVAASNGEKLVTSEGYTSKRDAKRGLATLITLFFPYHPSEIRCLGNG